MKGYMGISHYGQFFFILHQNLTQTCKKHEKADFDQRMVYTASKRWSKYTTHNHPHSNKNLEIIMHWSRTG